MKNKLVSIIIPTYTRCDMLERAIESVLNQTYKNIEIIVVDDNDSDSEYRSKTEEFMKKYDLNNNVKYLKHIKNMNGAVARNTGIKNCNGDYIGFLDDDDEFLPEKIEKQVKILNRTDKKIGGVYCGFNIIRGNKLMSKNIPNCQGKLSKELLMMEWGTGSGSNVLFKKEVLESINGFDQNLTRHQDWDVLLNMFRKYEIIVLKDVLLNIYKDSRINIPDVNKFIKVKKYFIEKFNDLIIETNIEKQIYQKHCLEIVVAFIKNKQYNKALKCYSVAKTYGNISNKNKLFLLLSIVYVNLPFKEKILILFSGITEKLRIVKD